MIIIVEGIDRVGKSTLCNKLSKELRMPIYKHDNKQFDYSAMDNENETDKMLQLIDLYGILNGDVIFDRFHMSDLVYGIMLRNYNVQSASKNYKLIDDRLSGLWRQEAILILVKPTDIEKSSHEHGTDLTEYDRLMQAAFDMSDIEMKYICDYNSIDLVVEKLKIYYYSKEING